MEKYDWVKKELIKKRILIILARVLDNDYETKVNYINYSKNIKNMMKRKPSTDLESLNYKNYFKNNKEFYELLSSYSKEKLSIIVDIILNNNFIYITDNYCFNNKGDIIKHVSDFLESIGKQDAKKELNDAIRTKRLKIETNDIISEYQGSCYQVLNKPYYYSINNTSDNSICTLSHELMHGLDFLHDKEKYLNLKYCIFNELTSILSELYCCDYQYNNGLITEFEKCIILNNIYLNNIDNNIEVIYVLLKICRLNKLSIKNIKILSNNVSEKMLWPKFSFFELIDYLDTRLTYLYSGVTAICIYEKHKDDPKLGMKIATDIYNNINDENEITLLDYYLSDLDSSIKKYTDDNNNLVKKLKRNN